MGGCHLQNIQGDPTSYMYHATIKYQILLSFLICMSLLVNYYINQRSNWIHYSMNYHKCDNVVQETYRLRRLNKYRYDLETDSFHFLSKTEAISFYIYTTVIPLYSSILSTFKGKLGYLYSSLNKDFHTQKDHERKMILVR